MADPPTSTSLDDRRPLNRFGPAVLFVLLAALIVAFVSGALAEPDSAIARWLPIVATITAAAVCAVRALTDTVDRGAWTVFAAALGVWTLGSLYDVLRMSGVTTVSGPTFADACHVAFYPLAYLGMVQLVRRRVNRFAAALWLDGLIGALAVAAVATSIVLPPALDESGDNLTAVILRFIFPLGDMLLLAFVSGVMALNAWRPGRAWVTLGAAFGSLAIAHAVDLSATASSVASSGIDLLMWPVGMVLIAFAALQQSDLQPHIRLEGWGLLVAPTLFGWITVALVGYGNFQRLGSLGLALAGATLFLVMVRAALTFRENATIARELRDDVANSGRDSLTGLPNHRAFHEALERETSLARRHERELSVIVIDVDDMKRVNQQHGHQVGDEVLIEVGRRIAATLRSEDVLARVGGEEFACLLPSTGGQAAWRAAERARQALEDGPFGEAGVISISAGVCDLEMAGDERELLRLASGALYWAKTHGRNVTYRYSPDVMDVLSADERAEQAERSRTLSAITALARAVDAKDATTQRHSERVGAVASALAGVMGWSTERRAKLHEAGLVHDVGKIGVPDTILRKTAPLTAAEAEVMEGHAALGARIVQDVLSAEQALWVLHHHERWDGDGYPHRIAGDAIPEGAQILAVADSWDAMTANRHYRLALRPEAVIVELKKGSGAQWSPRAVAALVALWESGRLLPASTAAETQAAAALGDPLLESVAPPHAAVPIAVEA